MALSQYCCSKMEAALDHKTHPFMHEPETNEYYVEVHYTQVIQLISYCPWCTKKLGVAGSKLQDVQKQCTAQRNEEQVLPYIKDQFPKIMQTNEWWRFHENCSLPWVSKKELG